MKEHPILKEGLTSLLNSINSQTLFLHNSFALNANLNYLQTCKLHSILSGYNERKESLSTLP